MAGDRSGAGQRSRERVAQKVMRASALVTPLACALMLAPARAQAAAAYVNPFAGGHPVLGRIDMGVDVCLSRSTPVRAVGSGVVTGIERNWYRHQPYLWYRLTSGRYAGHYVYVAEQVTHLARVGQSVRRGQIIAQYARTGTCMEIGWAVANGRTLAEATTGYKEGQVTAAGKSFARFLASLGVR
jgi:murein DD-endopeptidase MepM/ murein hydrolase activator NlpD